MLGEWGQLVGNENSNSLIEEFIFHLSLKTLFAPYIAKGINKYVIQDNSRLDISMC